MTDKQIREDLIKPYIDLLLNLGGIGNMDDLDKFKCDKFWNDTHEKAQKAINDLVTGLASQIEISNALRAQLFARQGELVYQVVRDECFWLDVDLETYQQMKETHKRILYTSPPSQAQPTQDDEIQRKDDAIKTMLNAFKYAEGATIDEVHQEYKANAIDEAIRGLEQALAPTKETI